MKRDGHRTWQSVTPFTVTRLGLFHQRSKSISAFVFCLSHILYSPESILSATLQLIHDLAPIASKFTLLGTVRSQCSNKSKTTAKSVDAVGHIVVVGEALGIGRRRP
jgi:hypothetical protein